MIAMLICDVLPILSVPLPNAGPTNVLDCSFLQVQDPFSVVENTTEESGWTNRGVSNEQWQKLKRPDRAKLVTVQVPASKVEKR